MPKHPFDVYGLGQCALDIIGRVESYPPPNVKCEFTDRVMQGGGPVATALVALSRWGLSCAFAGVIGDDLFGHLIRKSLADEHVDTGGLVQREKGLSQFAFILAEPATDGRRTIFWQRPTGDELRRDEIDAELIRTCKLVHTDGLLTEPSLCACQTARAAGVTVSVDAGTLRPGMLDLARTADVFVASEVFSRQLVGRDDPMAACRELASLGPRVVGVTLGERGYVGYSDGRLFKKPAYAVEALDTTGCGDVFHAGIVYGFLHGWEVERSFDFGAWAAAQVARRLGGRSGIPGRGEMEAQGYLG